MFWIPLAAGAALGVGKHYLVDKPKQQRMAKLAAETERYSPWTGLHAREVEQPNIFGSVMQGGMTGAMVGQGINGMTTAAPAATTMSSLDPSIIQGQTLTPWEQLMRQQSMRQGSMFG